MTVAGLYIPFLMNRGGNPVDAGIHTWWTLTKDNWSFWGRYWNHLTRWVKIRLKLLPVLLGNPFVLLLNLGFGVSIFTTLILAVPFLWIALATLAEAPVVPLFLILSGSTIFGAAIAPLGIRSTLSSYMHGLVIGIAGGLLLLVPGPLFCGRDPLASDHDGFSDVAADRQCNLASSAGPFCSGIRGIGRRDRAREHPAIPPPHAGTAWDCRRRSSSEWKRSAICAPWNCVAGVSTKRSLSGRLSSNPQKAFMEAFSISLLLPKQCPAH